MHRKKLPDSTSAILPSTHSVYGGRPTTKDLSSRGCGPSRNLMHGIAARGVIRKQNGGEYLTTGNLTSRKIK
jgi:hypothetical protein